MLRSFVYASCIVPSTNYDLTEAWLEIDSERGICNKCFHAVGNALSQMSLWLYQTGRRVLGRMA